MRMESTSDAMFIIGTLIFICLYTYADISVRMDRKAKLKKRLSDLSNEKTDVDTAINDARAQCDVFKTEIAKRKKELENESRKKISRRRR